MIYPPETNTSVILFNTQPYMSFDMWGWSVTNLFYTAIVCFVIGFAVGNSMDLLKGYILYKYPYLKIAMNDSIIEKKTLDKEIEK